jgi:purine nucleoside phosphorylase
MTNVKLSEATKIDFTGTASGFQNFAEYGEEVKKLLRNSSGHKVCVIVDRGFAFKDEAPYVVRDHLNLTGHNPLVGPNDPCGERFPAVNNTYVAGSGDLSGAGVKEGVVAGLREGVVPSADDVSFIHSMGADCCSYNLVPAMIVAAHSGWKVVGVIVPEGVSADTVLSAMEKGGK